MQNKKAGIAPGAMTLVLLASGMLALAATESRAADAAHGKLVFAQCAACHSDKPDAIGPSLKGVYGRKSAADPDFHYSNAMMRANLTWDDADLHAYLKDPQAKVKGNRMPFGGLGDAKDVDDVVAYLKDYK
jgi:cytochrome c